MIQQVLEQNKAHIRILTVFGSITENGGMWRWASELSKSRRARKAAVAVILPLMERSRHRLGGISDVTWADPYVVGFVVMLITIVARIEVGKIEGVPLCRVQAKAWEDITTERSGMIGEEVLLLSTARHRDFETGCRDAFSFGSMLVRNSILFAGGGRQDRHGDLHEADPAQEMADRDDVSAAWEHFFDTRVLARTCCIMAEPGQTAL